jgi:hypothetical protein
MHDERLFTREEAEAELEDLRVRLPRIARSRAALIRESRRIEVAVASDGGGVEGRDAFESSRTLRRDITELADRGILLRDPESGLVDFPGERDGRQVFLCWRLGEDHVDWWHEEDSGFLGRKPL